MAGSTSRICKFIERLRQDHSLVLRVESEQRVVRHIDRAVVFVTHAQVQRQPGIDFEVVLEIGGLFIVEERVPGAVEARLIGPHAEEKVARHTPVNGTAL